MPYPAVVTGTDEFSPAYWLSSLSGPYENGVAGVRFLFFTVNVFNGGTGFTDSNLTAWKSTDSGQTWAIVDAANSPLIAGSNGLVDYNTFRDPNPATHVIHCVFANPTGALVTGNPALWHATPVIQPFDMDTDSWGAQITGGPTMVAQFGYGNGDAFRPTLLAYANGDFQILYQSTRETINTLDYDRVSTALYNGAWNAGVAAFGAGETKDYAPMNMVLGDAGRVHLFAVSITDGGIVPRPPGFPAFFGDRTIQHRPLNAGVLGAQNLVTADIVPNVAVGGGDFVASVVTRPNGGSTELIAGYLRPATGNPLSYTSFPAITRALSADAPAWTPESVNADLAKASTQQFVNAPVMIVGASIYQIWSHLDTDTWYALNNGSGWGPAQLLFNDPTGSTGQYNNGLGMETAGKWGYTTGRFLHPGVTLLYFELAGGGLAITCNNPPVGIVGTAYVHEFPASEGTPPYSFAITAGTLPPGLNLDPLTGIVSGRPTVNGTFSFTIQVTDDVDATSSVQCSITINKRCMLVEVR
jgi:hypothetical protein